MRYKFRRTDFICPEEQFVGPLGGQQIDFRRIIDFSDEELITLINEYPHLAKRYFEWFEVHEKEEKTTNAKGKGKRKKSELNEPSTAESDAAETKETEAQEDASTAGK